jgi:hypothetical protein
MRIDVTLSKDEISTILSYINHGFKYDVNKKSIECAESAKTKLQRAYSELNSHTHEKI